MLTFEDDDVIAREPTALVVAVYETDRRYGGPEEGGWYYDAGELRRVVRVFRPHQKVQAYSLARRINRALDYKRRQDPHYRSPSSVLYAGGHLEAEVHKNTAPEFYPERRPHYE